MVKNKLCVKILITISMTGMLYSMAGCTLNGADYTGDGVVDPSKVMIKTKSGKIAKLKLTNNPIAVILKDLDEKSKQIAIAAINQLDEISENINYQIFENENVSISQQIIISEDNSLIEKLGAWGQTVFTLGSQSGTIYYPIYITFDKESIISQSQTIGTDILPSVIKHELLHSLGFEDIYDYRDKYDTIMYYKTINANRALDYTESDKYYIKKIYDECVEDVCSPEFMKVVYVQNKKEEDYEFVM